MKKLLRFALFLIVSTLISLSAMAQQAFTTAAPGTSLTLTDRKVAGATDSLNSYWFGDGGNKFYQFYTSAQQNARFLYRTSNIPQPVTTTFTGAGSSASALYFNLNGSAGANNLTFNTLTLGNVMSAGGHTGTVFNALNILGGSFTTAGKAYFGSQVSWNYGAINFNRVVSTIRNFQRLVDTTGCNIYRIDNKTHDFVYSANCADTLDSFNGVRFGRSVKMDSSVYIPRIALESGIAIGGIGYTSDHKLVPTGSAPGSVTTVSVVTVNGLSGSVANATTTPAITLTLSTIKPNVVAQTPLGVAGTDSVMVKKFSDGTMKAISPTYYGAGGSFLTIANNLSDVASLNTSRNNLGLQTVWNRKGVVLLPSIAADQNNLGEMSVIYDTDPVILTSATNVFKAIFTGGYSSPNIYYAESLDGVNWVRYATAIIAAHDRGFLFKNGSTLYVYCANIANTQLDQYTVSSSGSPSGWALAHSAVVTASSLSISAVYSPGIIIESGTWKMELECNNGTEVVYYLTSPDGVTWSQGATNPVISLFTGGNPNIHKIGSTYYIWGHGSGSRATLPTDGYFQSSTDLIHWSAATLFLQRRQFDEGASYANGQIVDFSLLQVGNSTYMWYGATPDGTVGGAHNKLAVANMTLAQVVNTTQGDGGDIQVLPPAFLVNPTTNQLYYHGPTSSTFVLDAAAGAGVQFDNAGTNDYNINIGTNSLGHTDLQIGANVSPGSISLNPGTDGVRVNGVFNAFNGSNLIGTTIIGPALGDTYLFPVTSGSGTSTPGINTVSHQGIGGDFGYANWRGVYGETTATYKNSVIYNTNPFYFARNHAGTEADIFAEFAYTNTGSSLNGSFIMDESGSAPFTADATALMDIRSTTKGVLLPRMTTTQQNAITSPTEGLLVYDNVLHALAVRTNSAWVDLGAGGGGFTNPMTTTGDMIYSSSGSTPARLGIGSTNQVLTVIAGVPSWQTPAGGGSPGGATTNIQYNSSGAFAGDAHYTLNTSTFALYHKGPTGVATEVWDSPAGTAQTFRSNGTDFGYIGSAAQISSHSISNTDLGLVSATGKVIIDGNTGVSIFGTLVLPVSGTFGNSSNNIVWGSTSTNSGMTFSWASGAQSYSLYSSGNLGATNGTNDPNNSMTIYPTGDVSITNSALGGGSWPGIQYAVFHGATAELILTGGGLAVPSTKLLLDVTSTAKGVRFSSMTSTQRLAISSPVTGEEVFDSTFGVYMSYNGSAWIGLSPLKSNSTTTGAATTAVTVTPGVTFDNTNYVVTIIPRDLLTAVNYYISAQTTTSFTVTFITALTGSINFDYTISL